MLLRHCTTLITLALIATFPFAFAGSGTPEGDVKSVLAEALEAAGGAMVSDVKTVSFTVRGQWQNGLQGYSAGKVLEPKVQGEFTIRNVFDFAGNRFYQEIYQELDGGFQLRFGTLYTGGELFNIVFERKQQSKVIDGSASVILDPGSRMAPALILGRAKKNLESLKVVERSGDATVLEFDWDEKQKYRIKIAEGNARLAELSFLSPDSLEGTTEVQYHYFGGSRFGGVWFPERVELRRWGVVVLDLKYEHVRINEPLPPADFFPPEGFSESAPVSGLSTKRIDEGLYEISGIGGGPLYKCQFFEFPDFVVVFEAPLNAAVTKAVLDEIRKTTEKPVKYAVISHFHSDHSGGIAAQLRAGATIVTTGKNVPLFKRMIRASFKQAGVDGEAGDSSFKVVEESISIPAARNRALEVIRISNTPHVEDMLVLYDPATKTILQGDLYSDLTPFNKTFSFFAGWLKGQRRPVDRILGTHHEAISWDEFMAKVEKD